MFSQGGELEVAGIEPSQDEAYILKARYLATEYKVYPWTWDPFYPCDQWCPEDIETILQCDIALYKFNKLKQHPSVSQH